MARENITHLAAAKGALTRTRPGNAPGREAKVAWSRITDDAIYVMYVDHSIAKFLPLSKDLTPSIRNSDFMYWLVEGAGTEWERMGF
jgi:hypothetical protein